MHEAIPENLVGWATMHSPQNGPYFLVNYSAKLKLMANFFPKIMVYFV